MIDNPTVLANLQSETMRLVVLVEVDTPSGLVNVHTRIGQKYWDGKIWQGVGELGQITGLASGKRVGQFTLVLNSPDISLLNETNQEGLIGRQVKLWLCSMNAHRRIDAANLIAFKYVSSIVNKPGKVHQVSITCGSARERFKSAKENHRFTSAAWRKRYPGDSYCDEIEALAKGPLSSYEGSQRVGRGVGGTGRNRYGGRVEP